MAIPPQAEIETFYVKIFGVLWPRIGRVKELISEFNKTTLRIAKNNGEWSKKRKEYFEERAIYEPSLLDPNAVQEGMSWEGRKIGDEHGTCYECGTQLAYEREINKDQVKKLLNSDSQLLDHLTCAIEKDYADTSSDNIIRKTARYLHKLKCEADDEEFIEEEFTEAIYEKRLPKVLDMINCVIAIEAWAPVDLCSSNEPKFPCPLPPENLSKDLALCAVVAGLAAVHDAYAKGKFLYPTPDLDAEGKADILKSMKPFITLRDEVVISQASDKWISVLEQWLIWVEQKLAQTPVVPTASLEGGNGITPVDEKLLVELDAKTPALDRENGKWVSNKRAAKLEGLQTSTLCDYRKVGLFKPDKTIGRDNDGRVWRRKGTPKSHPWYLRSSLMSEGAQKQSG